MNPTHVWERGFSRGARRQFATGLGSGASNHTFGLRVSAWNTSWGIGMKNLYVVGALILSPALLFVAARNTGIASHERGGANAVGGRDNG